MVNIYLFALTCICPMLRFPYFRNKVFLSFFWRRYTQNRGRGLASFAANLSAVRVRLAPLIICMPLVGKRKGWKPRDALRESESETG